MYQVQIDNKCTFANDAESAGFHVDTLKIDRVLCAAWTPTARLMNS
jgi:hypothetical protein